MLQGGFGGWGEDIGSVLVSRGYSLGSLKGPPLGLMLHCHCLEILHNFRTRGTHLHCILGPTNDAPNLSG